MKTIVSITPLRINADSRTFKIAASFTRFGYRSIVVEGEKSNSNPAHLPFELRSVNAAFINNEGAREDIQNVPLNKGNNLRHDISQLAKRLPGILRKPLLTLAFPFRYLNRFVLSIVRVIPGASLYYLHAPYQFPPLYWLSRQNDTPFIYDAHDFYPVVDPNIFYRRLEAWCIEKAAAVVTVSEGIAKLMRQEFGCQPVILRNCQDGRLYRKPIHNLRQMLGLGDDVFLLASVGQAKAGQAVTEALEALNLLPQSIHLALVGKNTDQYRDMVKDAGLQARVHLVPPVQPDEVVEFIGGADAAIILYHPLSLNYENCLPNGFFQSISAGLPLLYPELTEMKKLAEKYGMGIPINPKSPESIRAGVITMLNDTDSLSKGKENLRQARQELSWEREEIILHDLITHVLKEEPEEVG